MASRKLIIHINLGRLEDKFPLKLLIYCQNFTGYIWHRLCGRQRRDGVLLYWCIWDMFVVWPLVIPSFSEIRPLWVCKENISLQIRINCIETLHKDRLHTYIFFVVSTCFNPFWKIWYSQLGFLLTIHGKSNVPKHQPESQRDLLESERSTPHDLGRVSISLPIQPICVT